MIVRERKTKKILEDMGIDYDFPEYVSIDKSMPLYNRVSKQIVKCLVSVVSGGYCHCEYLHNPFTTPLSSLSAASRPSL